MKSLSRPRLSRRSFTALALLWLCTIPATAPEGGELDPYHPCAAAYEAFQAYMRPLIDDFQHVRTWEEVEPSLRRWQRCCPEGRAIVSIERFVKPVPDSLKELPLPPIFSSGSSCVSVFTGVPGYYWQLRQSQARQAFWREHYGAVSTKVYDCCVRQFQLCLKEAAGGTGTSTLPAAVSQRCFARYSPDAIRSPGFAFAMAAGTGVGAALIILTGVVAAWPGVAGRRRYGWTAFSVLAGLSVFLLLFFGVGTGFKGLALATGAGVLTAYLTGLVVFSRKALRP